MTSSNLMPSVPWQELYQWPGSFQHSFLNTSHPKDLLCCTYKPDAETVLGSPVASEVKVGVYIEKFKCIRQSF